MSDRVKPDIPYVGYKMPKHFGYIEIKTPEGVVYMRRWYLFMCKWFSIRLHHIKLPDLDVWPHNHPWSFVSFVIRGGYRENWCLLRDFKSKFVGAIVAGERVHRWDGYTERTVRRFSYHHYADLHKIDSFLRGRSKGAWTLMVTGPVRQKWGFMTDQGFFSAKELGVGNIAGKNDAEVAALTEEPD